MKKHNPSIPIMLREAQGTLPKVYARYDFGKEKSQSLEGMGNSFLRVCLVVKSNWKDLRVMEEGEG